MELPQSYIDENVRAMYDAARQKQAQRAALTQQRLAQQQTALDDQRFLRQSEIDQAVSELSDDEKKFPAVMHDLARERAIIDIEHKRRSAALRTFGLPSGEAERAMKVEEESLQPLKEMAKPFEETTQYKTAEKNWAGLKNVKERVGLVLGSVNKAQELMDVDEGAALRHMKTNLIKPLNSILSNDAIQLSEMLIRYNDLLNAPETAQLGGKSVFNPTTWFNKYTQSEDNKKPEMLAELTDKVFQANPKRFLETAINGVNGYIDGYNNMLQEQVISPTSPGLAKQMGAIPIQPVAPRVKPEEFPRIFQQPSIPFQAQPVQSGSAQMPSQQQQSAPAVDLEAIRNRVRSGYKQP